MTTPQYQLSFSFTHVPPVMKRGYHALISVRDKQGNFILGAKDIYPQGIYRLVGGGLKPGEDPQKGACRELNEEFKTHLNPSDLHPLAAITVKLDEQSTQRQYAFVTTVYQTTCQVSDLHPSDDLDGMKVLSREQMNALVDRYYDLSDELIALTEHGEDSQAFRWRDYGRLYGRIHEIVLELSSA